MLDIFNNVVEVGDLVAYPQVVHRHYELRTGIVESVESRNMIGYAKIRADKTNIVVERRTSEISKGYPKCS